MRTTEKIHGMTLTQSFCDVSAKGPSKRVFGVSYYFEFMLVGQRLFRNKGSLSRVPFRWFLIQWNCLGKIYVHA